MFIHQMVEELETEIAAYESETGRQQTGVSTATGNFSGYTASLITAVTKLMGYLKEVLKLLIITNNFFDKTILQLITVLTVPVLSQHRARFSGKRRWL